MSLFQSKCIHVSERKQTGKMLALVLVSSWEMPKELFVHRLKYQGFFIVELWGWESGRTFPWQLIDVMFIYWVAGNDTVSNWHFSFFLLFFSPVKICFSGWKWQPRLPFYFSEFCGERGLQFNLIQLFYETYFKDPSLPGPWRVFIVGSCWWEDDLQSKKQISGFIHLEMI
jgi:hypothetical protein